MQACRNTPYHNSHPDGNIFLAALSSHLLQIAIYSTNNLIVFFTAKPIITLRSHSPVEVDEGNATTLLCGAILSRFQTLEWTKRSTILHRSYGAAYNLSYTITSATKDDAGVYTCKVFPGLGQPAQYITSYNVTLKVRCKLPIWTCRHFVIISISD